VNLFENNKEIKMGIEMCLDADERVKIAALKFAFYVIIFNRKYSKSKILSNSSLYEDTFNQYQNGIAILLKNLKSKMFFFSNALF